VKQSDITHITLAFHLYSSQVPPSSNLLVNSPLPSQDANVTEQLLTLFNTRHFLFLPPGCNVFVVITVQQWFALNGEHKTESTPSI
jgi:hypothetical protein